jgi:uncharacterized OB-fold protein
MAAEIPVVDYLALGAEPHLVALQCDGCAATYFGRRNACANCGGVEFTPVEVGTEGTVRAFTIVAFAAPGVTVPFVSAIVDCDGTSVRANVVNTPADPDHVHLGMKVKLTTFPMGADTAGTEAIGFGFEPIAS